jgi:predicted transcriptional regulator
MALMAAAPRRKAETEPSEFGWLLLILMQKNRIKNATRLAEVISEKYPISQQMVSNYINGKNKVPVAFVSQVIDRLEMTDEEQDGLANAWANTLPEREREVVARVWKSRQPTKDNLEAARRIEEEDQDGLDRGERTGGTEDKEA